MNNTTLPLWTDSLRAYAEEAHSNECSSRRGLFAEQLRRDPEFRRQSRLKFKKFLNAYKRCEEFPRGFAEDPESIDRYMIDLECLSKLVEKSLCPWVSQFLEEARTIAERSQTLRIQLLHLSLAPAATRPLH